MEPILSMLTNQLVCYQQIFVEYIPCAHHRRDCQILYYWFPRWHSSKESACQCRRCRFNPQVGIIPWNRKWQPAPVFLPGKSHGQRSLVGSQESDTTEQLSSCMCAHTDTHIFAIKKLTIYLRTD